MKNLLIAFLVICSLKISAQKTFINLLGGISNYQGDLQEKRFSLNQSHAAFGLGLSYEITDNIFARLNATFSQISSNDANGTKNRIRNLNFSSPITDIHLGVEYNIFNLYDKKFTPYVFGGISYFTFNPFTNDALGKRINLQPLSTEGQGFVSGREPYKLSQFAIPFGGGIKFAVTDNFRIGLEVGIRKTFTDYIDDVSTTFVDENLLLANRGQLAVDVAFRSDEINPNLLYPAAGTIRGSDKNKDWYYFSGITAAFRLGSGGNKKGIGCPSAVY